MSVESDRIAKLQGWISQLELRLSTAQATAKRRQALLRKHQWGAALCTCPECAAAELIEPFTSVHKTGCAIAAELKEDGDA